MSGCPTLADVQDLPSFHPELPEIAQTLMDFLEVDDVPPSPPTWTVFCSRSAAKAPPVDRYLYRMCMYAAPSPEIFIYQLIYLRRYCKCTGLNLGLFNIHRLLISALTVAIKLRDDSQYPASYYAKVGGVSPKELALMEREFLFAIKWDISVSVSEYNSVVRRLATQSNSRLVKQMEASTDSKAYTESTMGTPSATGSAPSTPLAGPAASPAGASPVICLPHPPTKPDTAGRPKISLPPVERHQSPVGGSALRAVRLRRTRTT